jgi:outer membrane receptor protein involved in Fe transport
MAFAAALPLPGLALAQAAPAAPAPAAPPRSKPPSDRAPDTTVGGVVITSKTPPITTAIDRRSYSVSGDLQAQTGSIADALRNVPSVEVDVQGNVSLRGDGNVTILIDGKPSTQFQGDNKAQALQQLPANQIERVEVMTNPSAEFRADGTGGIINLVTKKAKGVGVTGSTRLSAGADGRLVAGANVGYNSKTLSLTADGTYRHDALKANLAEDRQRLVAGGFDDTRQDQVTHFKIDSLATHAGADYDLDAKTRLSGNVRVNLTDFRLGSLAAFDAEDPFGAPTSRFVRALQIDQTRTNGQVSAALRRKFAGLPGHEVNLTLTYDMTQDDRVRDGHTTTALPVLPDSYDQQRIVNRLTQLDFKGDYVRPMAGGVTLKAGFDLQRDDNGYLNRGFRGPTPAALAPDALLTNRFEFRQTLSQAYVTYEHPFGRLTALAGLRVEATHIDLTQVTQAQHDTNDYTRLYPTLHLAWKVDESQQFTASYSHRVQRPGAEEYNAFRFLLDPLNYRAGNPDLKPQETHSLEAGYQLRKFPATFYLATLFYRENYNGVADVVTPLGGGVFLSTRQNLAKSRNAGLELVNAGRLTKTLTYNVSGSVFWTQLDSLGPAFAPTRDTYSGSARANFNWQVTKDDLVQVNLLGIGKRLTVQGYSRPTGGVNLGYRHKLTDKIAFVATAQDIFGTFKDTQVIDTPTLRDHTQRSFDSRQMTLGFVWTFGGGKVKDPGFDYGGGATPPPQ